MILLGVVANARRIAGGGGPGGALNKTLMASADGASSVNNISANSTTTFIDLLGGQRQRTTNEIRACLKITKAGKIRKLRCYVVTNTRSTTTSLYLRVNSANSALVTPVSAGATGWQEDDGTQEVTVAAGDYICIGVVTGTGGGNFGQLVVQVEYEADDVPTTYFVFNGNETAVNSSATKVYQHVSGYGRSVIFGWEGNASRNYRQTQTSIGAPATISNARIYIVSNTFNVATVFTLMKNGSATAITVTVGAGSTGEFVDTTHSITVADGDYLEWECDPTGRTSGDLGVGRIELTAESTGNTWDMFGMVQAQEDPAINASGVQTFAWPATRMRTGTTEAQRQIKPSFDIQVTKARGNATAAGTGAASYDVYVRDDAVDTVVKFGVTTGSNANSLLKDTTNSADIAADSLVSVGLTPLGNVSALYVFAMTCESS